MRPSSWVAGDDVLAKLRAAKAFVFDMDGTLVLGDYENRRLRALPGAVEIVEHLAGRGVPLAIFTNGTARPPEAYGEILRGLGFPLPDSHVLTPSRVAVEACLSRGHRRVMVLGREGIVTPLEEAGIEVVPPRVTEIEAAPRGGRARSGGDPVVTPGPANGTVDAVVVGWFREVRFEHIEAACNAVWAGARLYSASQSLFFAVAGAGGKSLGTSRAICAAITDLTGRRPEIVGKPSLRALRSAARVLGTKTSELAVVGDDPDLEVPMAHRGHALAIAVTTGVGGWDSFAGLPPERRPHLMVDGLDRLLGLYCPRRA